MKRARVSVLMLLVVALLSPAAQAKPKKHPKARPAEPALLVPLRLELSGIDLQSGAAQVLVYGPGRAPELRHFVLTDERQRRFVPSQGECQALPAAEGGAADPARNGGPWRCRLVIARIYQRAALVGVTVTLRERSATAAEERVRSLWAEARARTPLPATAERPRGGNQPWSGGHRPDGPDGPDGRAGGDGAGGNSEGEGETDGE